MAEEAPARPLKIAIIGAGIAGLATAIALRIHGTRPHDAVVFEKYGEAEPTFSGPVQLQPNATKILTRYGVADAVSKSLPELHSVHNIHRYSDGKLLSSTSAKLVNSTYKLPIWNISRHRFSQILLERAREVGVELKFNTAIDELDTSSLRPTVRASDGQSYSYDLIIAADGIRSASRDKILGYRVNPVNPLTAYSVNLARDKMAADPDLKFLLNRSGFWSGPRSGVNHMDMPDFHDSCNFVFTIENKGGDEGEWYKQCDVEQVRRQYAAFEPRIHKILDLATEKPYIWKLSDLPTLETWRSSTSRAVLLGDAAHAMLPYAAQGAASGIEDALCIAECLDSAPTIDAALDAFERIRKPRTTFIARAGQHNMAMIHLPDGPEQEARDARFINSAPKPDAETPAPVTVPTNGQGDTKLEDFDPPAVVTGTFVPSTRAYIFEYDVWQHTVAFLNAVSS